MIEKKPNLNLRTYFIILGVLQNFIWISTEFKLDLARLKLTGIPEARYIYFIFLEPRIDQYILNEFCFEIFWLEFKFAQIVQLAAVWIKSEIEKELKATWPESTGGPSAQ
jgi:hypothetical protein